MTPAALHRLCFSGEDSFLRAASALVVAAPLFLAAGLSAESYVVLGKVTDNEVAVAGYAAVSFALLVGFWTPCP
jgi:hypothetical protein